MTETANTTDAAPRVPCRQQIIALLNARPGKHSVREISEQVSAPQITISTTIHKMLARGEIVRVQRGQYCLPTDPATKEAAKVVTPTPATLDMAIWHTGELTLRRDDAALALTPDEARTLIDFLQRVTR